MYIQKLCGEFISFPPPFAKYTNYLLEMEWLKFCGPGSPNDSPSLSSSFSSPQRKHMSNDQELESAEARQSKILLFVSTWLS